MPTERRWIILTSDGGHVSIGRHTDPSVDEIDAAARKLRKAGTVGWLAAMEGPYYGRGRLTLLMVREIGVAGGCWDDAVAAFQRRRLEARAGTSVNKPRPGPVG